MANSKKISNTKISTKNEDHRDNSSLLAKENSKDTERTNEEKEKAEKKREPKLNYSAVRKSLILGDSIIKNVDGWKLNRRIKSIVHSISGATTRAMKHHVMGCYVMGQTISEVKNQLRRLQVT